ncbi:hypothetical protein Tco_0622993 [Tanacetum coccineum]
MHVFTRRTNHIILEKRLEIRKCNRRLNPGKKQREPTFQVVLDALALTPCYSAFLTIADVPEVYVHQFWDSIHKYDTSYRVHGQNFNEPPTDEVIVFSHKELGHSGKSKSIPNVVVTELLSTCRELLFLLLQLKSIWKDNQS